jgi:hypothetical protein
MIRLHEQDFAIFGAGWVSSVGRAVMNCGETGLAAGAS